jgi:crotonobetainyl-CoA:carnitine CoA-transferase CaiB-like acyl-CoA transferase
MMLGALGADVIKFESVQRLDPYRFTWATAGEGRWYEAGPLWIDCNCDKRNVTLDLSSPEGKALFERLVEVSDVVISNFSNRVMPNLGFTKEHLHEINSQAIVVSMPGYGAGGPWEDYVGYGVAFEQLVCGAMTGYADGLPSMMGGFCDVVVALHTVAAIELALQQRNRVGRGLGVEVPQCETLDSLFAPEHIAVQQGAPPPERRGNRHEWMAPHNVYPVKGEDRWISIAVSADEEFAALVRVLGLGGLDSDRRFATMAARKRHEDALDELLATACAGHDEYELERALQAGGVKACRVAKGFELGSDPGLRHIGFFQEMTRDVTGTQLQRQWPFRFSSLDVSHKRPAATLGEHTAEVLCGLLGLGGDDIERFRERQVIGDVPLGIAG